MKIIFNNKIIECDKNITVSKLLEQLKQLKPGIALSINQHILPREQWNMHQLKSNDKILLFQIIAGG